MLGTIKFMQIPFSRQQNTFYCGPAIIKMTLGAHGMQITQKEAARRAQTNRTHGTVPSNLVQVFRDAGFKVRAGERQNLKTVAKALEKDAIVIVCYTEPIMEWGHYAIVKEISDGKVKLIDPDARTGRTAMLIPEFNRRWHDHLFTHTTRWAAIVEPPKKKEHGQKQP
jgi:ABC-type bacteriocin/lantibiotic exporter with double-glycine peptidase domain